MMGRTWKAAIVSVVAATAVFAYLRVGLLDLPSVPGDLTLQAAGLADLDEMGRRSQLVWSAQVPDRPAPVREGQPAAAPQSPLEWVQRGLGKVRGGDAATGLEWMRTGVRNAPDDLVLANAYRMIVFQLRRGFLREARQSADPTPRFPPHLERQPIAFFESLVRDHDSRGTRLSLALSWVDEMLLFPALEIKAPASVEAVRILDSILRGGDSHYVPALFARGMNHLHRPARLVWPEAERTTPDAAVRDFARCVAIGRRFGVGSARLEARLAIALGDGYVKAGRPDNARSWWQIAQNLCRDDEVQQAVRRRYAWRDEETLDRLEAELDLARSRLDRPLTDLALMWE